MSAISELHGTGTSHSEVTNISRASFWLLVENREYFVPFTDYPVFAQATLDQIFAVEHIAPRQLYWPSLDADIELDALEQPDSYPLTWRE
jgi:hypothetical protein